MVKQDNQYLQNSIDPLHEIKTDIAHGAIPNEGLMVLADLTIHHEERQQQKIKQYELTQIENDLQALMASLMSLTKGAPPPQRKTTPHTRSTMSSVLMKKFGLSRVKREKVNE